MKDELKVVKGVLDKVDNRQRQQSKELKDVKDVLGKVDNRQRQQSKQQAVLAQHVGVLVENSARMQRMFRKDDERLRSRVYIFTGDSQGLL